MLIEKLHAVSGPGDVTEYAFTEYLYEVRADALLDVVRNCDSDDGSSVPVGS